MDHIGLVEPACTTEGLCWPGKCLLEGIKARRILQHKWMVDGLSVFFFLVVVVVFVFSFLLVLLFLYYCLFVVFVYLFLVVVLFFSFAGWSQAQHCSKSPDCTKLVETTDHTTLPPVTPPHSPRAALQGLGSWVTGHAPTNIRGGVFYSSGQSTMAWGNFGGEQ